MRESSLLDELYAVVTDIKSYKYLALLAALALLQGVIVYLAYRLDAVANIFSRTTCVLLPSNTKLLIAIFGIMFFTLFAAMGAGEFVNALNREHASVGVHRAHKRTAWGYLALTSGIGLLLAGYIATWC